MNVTETIGRLFGQENVQSIDAIEPSLAAPWAQGNGLFWILFGAVVLMAASISFYLRWQPHGRRGIRLLLGVSRGLLLVLLFVILADPILTLKVTNRPRPLLWVLFDGTDSMGIQDELSESERDRLAKAVSLESASDKATSTPIAPRSPGDPSNTAKTTADSTAPSRIEYVQAKLRQPDNVFARLEKDFRIRTFVLDRADGVRSLDGVDPLADKTDWNKVADQLTTTGQVTAIGKGLEDLSLRHATNHLAGLIVVSDFGQNTGIAPVGTALAGSTASSPATKLGKPIYTLGIGPEAAIDLGVDLEAPLVMKKGESETITASLRQTGLDARQVTVRLSARRLAAGGDSGEGEPINLGSKDVELSGSNVAATFPYTPQETGRFRFTAEVEPVEGEVVRLNNRAEREANIRDDFLRLMYVENEPSWEWRFIKEVFHRDKLVGLRGFRTFLRSADPKVRQTNELFLPTLTPKRSDFFANDVIFLGEMQSQHLSPRFCEMTMEFVSKFGGGLVIIAGPRFGPGQLANTPLADMLPVIADSESRVRDDREFQMQLTAESLQFDFMRLGGESEAENRKAWDNLGKIPWYQPVLRKHPQAAVLAEHPTDTCADGKTRQPLIAIRPYGKGEVIYVGFNEMWRLRRMYGEQYYRQFWGQLIHRLGLSHAIGTQKRFVIRTDRQQYQADEKVTLTVEAYDANFEPLSADKIPNGEKRLSAELIVPGRTEGTSDVQPLNVAQLREGVFETRFPVAVGGEHRLRVKDPITGEMSEETFQVTSVSAERRSAVRNVSLEEEIATATGGRRYDLETIDRLPDEITLAADTEINVRVLSLASTWFMFGLVILLMLGEWSIRKLINLP